MRPKLIKLHRVKSHLIVQFDKFNGHASVAIACVSSPVKGILDACGVILRHSTQLVKAKWLIGKLSERKMSIGIGKTHPHFKF